MNDRQRPPSAATDAPGGPVPAAVPSGPLHWKPLVGWLLAEAEKADLGVMARSNAAWLTDLADGSAPFAVNILDPAAGYYKADFIFGGT